MRPNKVKQVLQAGGIATAISGHSISADTIDWIGPLGFEAFWIEGEHSSVTWATIGDMSRACDLWGMTPIVRVHENHKSANAACTVGVARMAIPITYTKPTTTRS